LTDGDLLRSFIHKRDEAALETLIHRHGPMVWGVCHRLLRNQHDAEDAFQAVFLVLVHKAATIRDKDAVANWLYGVARQTALRLRFARARLHQRERQVTEMPQTAAQEAVHDNELLALLDRELSRLPDKYRILIVLCDLEGKTRTEAARQLGCPEGTVAGRLARARAMLAKRLAQQGVAMPGGSLTTMLGRKIATADVPASVVYGTIQAATLVATGQAVSAGVISAKVAALTEGVLKTMYLTRLKFATAVLLLLALGACGTGWMAAPASPQDKRQAAEAATKQNQKVTAEQQSGKTAAPVQSPGSPLRVPGYSQGADFAAFLDSGKTILTVRGGSTACICDVDTGQERRSFKTIDYSKAAISPDRKTLAVGGWKELALYDVESGRARWKSSWPPDQQGFCRCWGVAFTPDGKRVVSASDDCFLRIWDVSSGKKLRDDQLDDRSQGPNRGLRLDGAGQRIVTALAMAPDGRTLAYGAKRFFWKPATPEDAEKLKKGLKGVKWTLGNALTLRLRNLDTAEEVEVGSKIFAGPEMYDPGVKSVALSPDGRYLAAIFQTSQGERKARWGPDGRPSFSRKDDTIIRVWDVPSRRELPAFGKVQTNLCRLAFSPSSHTLASIRWDGMISLWEMASGKVRRQFQADHGKNGGDAFSFAPDDRKLLSGVGQLELWDVTGPTSKEHDKAGLLTAQTLKALWIDLASEDAGLAYLTIWDLARAPDRSARFLGEQVRSSPLADESQVKKLIGDLESAEFRTRESATRELERLGETVWPALRKVLANPSGAETRRRAQRILAGTVAPTRSVEALRVVRAVEALDCSHSDEARKVLEALASGLPNTWAGYHATLAVEQRKKRR
jgi:RNA polymerase sigma factor (sigma-70 family)